MALIILIILALFLSLVNSLDLGWVLVKLVDLPTLYYHLFIWCVLVLRAGIYVWSRRWFFRSVASRFYKWIDEADRSGPGSPRNSGNGNVNGTRKFSTSCHRRGDASIVGSSKEKANPPLSLRKKISSMRRKVVDNFFKVIAKKGALVSLLSGRKARKGLPTMTTLLKKLTFRLFGAVFTAKGKYLSRVRQVHAFNVHLIRLTRTHGPRYTVKYLKVAQLAIQKAVAGNKTSSLRALDPGLPFAKVASCGLPSFIPLRDRRLMLVNGSPSVIRWWLTLYSLYRIISIPGELKLSTITDAMTVTEEAVKSVGREIVLLIPFLDLKLDFATLGDPTDNAIKVGRPKLRSIPLLESASSTHKVSWLGLVSDIPTLQHNGLLETMLDFLKLTDNKVLYRIICDLRSNIVGAQGLIPMLTPLGAELLKSPAGKLSLKEEPAGKVRVFAMVTAWDQAVLQPLHQAIFSALKLVPNDATFNQEASVNRCMIKAKEANASWGYDLSAATDRLPLLLQKMILNHFLPLLGDLWGTLLTDRDYSLKGGKKYPTATGIYRYSTGQPMGALSSWAMLALTHHLIAQLAAYRARAKRGFVNNPNEWVGPWFTGYELLGDDIVFFHEQVADEYLKLMETLGVPINLGKSVVAKNATFEFAKVTGHNGNHVAAISWAMFMSQPTAMGRVGICYSLLRKGIVKSHIVRYITTLSRESKYTAGIPNIFFLALGAMFAKNGRIPYAQFLYQVVDLSNGVLSIVPALTGRDRLVPLQKALSKLFLSGPDCTDPVPLEIQGLTGKDFNVSDLSLRRGIVKTLIAIFYGVAEDSTSFIGFRRNAMNPGKSAEKLAAELVVRMIWLGAEAQENALKALKAENAFALRPIKDESLSPVGRLVRPLYLLLFNQCYEFFLNVWFKLDKYTPSQLRQLSLTELLSLLDDVQRYSELEELPKRADQKLRKEIIPSKNLIESPLDVLIKVLKSETTLEYAKAVVLDVGDDVFKKLVASKDASLGAILEEEPLENPKYRAYKAPIPLWLVKGLVHEFGEQYLKECLPKWGRNSTYIGVEPNEKPSFEFFNYLQYQPQYLYSIGYLESLGGNWSNLCGSSAPSSVAPEEISGDKA